MVIKEKIEIVKGDITQIQVDVIVNAANSTLLGGGGVDGAIHRAAGKELLHECRQLHGCYIGEAKITKGYKLPAKFVIHTVGPVWDGGDYNEPVLLKSCYENSLVLAVKNNCRSIAFPAISTGVYRYPLEDATKIAIETTVEFLKQNKLPEKVVFVCFSEEMFILYKNYLNNFINGI